MGEKGEVRLEGAGDWWDQERELNVCTEVYNNATDGEALVDVISCIEQTVRNRG